MSLRMSLGVAEQHWREDAVLEQLVGSVEDLDLVALWKGDALLRLARLAGGDAHDLVAARDALLQLLAVGREVDFVAGHALVHGRFRHGGRHPEEHAGVEGFGNDVLAAEGEALAAIGARDRVGHLFVGQGGQRARGGHLHSLGDCRAPAHPARPGR